MPMLTFDPIFCHTPLGVPLHTTWHDMTDVVILQREVHGSDGNLQGGVCHHHVTSQAA